MPDKPVQIATDPNKARLKELRDKVRANVPLTPQETKEAIEKILKYLGLD